MGNELGRLDKVKTSSMLRQSISRINIHRGKRLNGIAKKKDDICKHLESSNETNAKIWCETLINDEAMIPVYDVISIMCDQLNGRLSTIEKFGPPKDMDQNFHTLIHAGAKLDVDELVGVRHQLSKLLGKQFVIQSDTDMTCINKVVADNIDIKIPEQGLIVLRLVQLAKERNIDYKPSHESQILLQDYCLRKNLANPLEGSGKAVVQNLNELPVYNPPPINNMIDPSMHNQQPPPFFQPPAGGNGIGFQQPPQPFNYQSFQPPPNQYPPMNQPPQNFNAGMFPPPNIGLNIQPINYDMPPPQNNTQPNFSIPDNNNPMGGQSQPDMERSQSSTMDDIEARLNALKRL
ncbi:UNKNOWN [Stylonychia lemnae]|uniref:IST1 homolog n=1 Tax=Stylonychia lemnae TaxID=5949 RepID=A0A078A7M0_STYLE|nr:UNKNOWN [Stylonychia lemnae]|eukprot:CDW76781.1 UNKNOWN [Stylonychia lemnae]